jgi:hypothetical protein
MTRRNVRYPRGVARASGAGGRRPGTTCSGRRSTRSRSGWVSVPSHAIAQLTGRAGGGRIERRVVNSRSAAVRCCRYGSDRCWCHALVAEASASASASATAMTKPRASVIFRAEENTRGAPTIGATATRTS